MGARIDKGIGEAFPFVFFKKRPPPKRGRFDALSARLRASVALFTCAMTSMMTCSLHYASQKTDQSTREAMRSRRKGQFHQRKRKRVEDDQGSPTQKLDLFQKKKKKKRRSSTLTSSTPT